MPPVNSHSNAELPQTLTEAGQYSTQLPEEASQIDTPCFVDHALST